MLHERFTSHTRAEIESARIGIARARLDRAEQIVTLRRSEYATTSCDARTREALLQVLKLSERAVFNRRLELELLLRTRRSRTPPQNRL
jgi:hypothetical protein